MRYEKKMFSYKIFLYLFTGTIIAA